MDKYKLTDEIKDLLAIIHYDGGEYTDSNGILKSIMAAKETVTLQSAKLEESRLKNATLKIEYDTLRMNSVTSKHYDDLLEMLDRYTKKANRYEELYKSATSIVRRYQRERDGLLDRVNRALLGITGEE